MIDQLYEYVSSALLNNQMLAAGIGTVVTGAIIAMCRNVPVTIYAKLQNFFTIEMVINTRHRCYDDVIQLLNTKRWPFLTRNFSLTWDGKDKGSIIPGYGSSYGMYNGKLFHFNKTKLENKNEIEDQIVVTFLSRNRAVIGTLVKEATKSDEFSKTIKIYSGSSGLYGSVQKEIPKRSLETVFINKDLKESASERISSFLNNEQWYIERGIPYKLSLLFYGEPGTGKTSLIKALASHHNKNIRYLDNFDRMGEVLVDTTKEDIIVIEDIDAINNLSSREAEGTFNNDKDQLQRVLNILDGFNTPHGAIFLITTNYIDKLDPALKRKGRIDESYEIPKVSKEVMCDMFYTFYGDALVSDNVPYSLKTGAQLQDIFLNNSKDEAIELLKS